MLAPILAFTAEEIWTHLPHTADEPDSVHIALFPRPAECRAFPDEALDERWGHLREVRTEVLKALEQARAQKRISGALEARVVLAADGTLAELLELYAAWLPALFIVSQVELILPGAACDLELPDALRSQTLPGLSVTVRRADGAKCERCWNYSIRVGGEAATTPRCASALRRGPFVKSTRRQIVPRITDWPRRRRSDWRGRWLWLTLTLAIVAADRAVKYAVERYTSEGISARTWCRATYHRAGTQRELRHRLRVIIWKSAPRWISALLIGKLRRR